MHGQASKPLLSKERGCSTVDFKQMILCGVFKSSQNVLLFHVVMFIFDCCHLLWLRHSFRHISQQRPALLDTMSQTDAFHKALKLHRVKLLMCCHSCWCVCTRNEASAHITLTEMDMCMLCVCTGINTYCNPARQGPAVPSSCIPRVHCSPTAVGAC